MGPWAGQTALFYGRGIEARVRNNIFIAKNPALPLRVEQPQQPLRFENNLYWREGAPVQIAWGAQTYSSLSDWRERTGQESVAGEPTGLFTHPALTAHPPEVRPGQPVGLTSLRAFQPLINSPALMGGLDLRGKFGLDIGLRDFTGRVLPSSARLPLGAISPPSFQ